jgi:hypothetical protein
MPARPLARPTGTIDLYLSPPDAIFSWRKIGRSRNGWSDNSRATAIVFADGRYQSEDSN